MKKKAKPSEPVELVVWVTKGIEERLTALVTTGLWGDTESQAAERLIARELLRMEKKGWTW